MVALDRSHGGGVFRFAPSPNGPLHIGHALSALTGQRMARRTGGRFLIRIEDIDTGRSREDHVAGVLDDLAFLGITSDGPILRQSSRFDAYREAAARLDALGVLFRCDANRSDIAAAVARVPDHPRDPDGAPVFPAVLKPRAGRTVAPGRPFALRLDMGRALELVHVGLQGRELSYAEFDENGAVERRQCQPERWGDVVLVRKDVPASYHLAVVVDDAFQGVTHVTRGQDLQAATDIHRVLQVLLGLPEPIYHHHRLITGADGLKLSKSAGAAGLRSLGLSAGELRLQLGFAEQPD